MLYDPEARRCEACGKALDESLPEWERERWCSKPCQRALLEASRDEAFGPDRGIGQGGPT